MQSSDVYITVGLDRQGNVQEVRVNGKMVEPKISRPGLVEQGETAPGCEEIVKRLVHELLICRKKGSKGDSAPGTGPASTPPEPGTGSDPCCYRDPATGRIWCWC